MRPPLRRVSNELLDGQFLFSSMRFYFICFFGLSAFLFYHGQSISLLCHHHFKGQIENGPMDSFFFCRLRGFIGSNFLLCDDLLFSISECFG